MKGGERQKSLKNHLMHPQGLVRMRHLPSSRSWVVSEGTQGSAMAEHPNMLCLGGALCLRSFTILFLSPCRRNEPS